MQFYYENFISCIAQFFKWKGKLQVFLKPEEKYEQLQAYICEQTSVVAEAQILLYLDRLLASEVADSTPGKVGSSPVPLPRARAAYRPTSLRAAATTYVPYLPFIKKNVLYLSA